MKSKMITTVAGTCLAAVCLSSCYIFWNTGKRIKDLAVTYTASDIFHPVGGVVYKDSKGNFYMQAQEVQYKKRHQIVGIETLHDWQSEDTYTYHCTYTGRTDWVQVRGNVKNGRFQLDFCFMEYVGKVPALPAGAKAIPCQGDGIGLITHLGYPGEKESAKMSWLATTVAAPFEYVVDPVLTGTTTAAVGALMVCGAVITSPVLLPCYLLATQQQ